MKNVEKTKRVAAVFLSETDLSTEERNVTKNVCMTVRPQMDVSGTGMTTRYQYLHLDLLTQPYHVQYTGTSHPPAHTVLL